MAKLDFNKKRIVYVVTMYRFGDREKHSYVTGVYSKKQGAINAGEMEEVIRGGKYKPDITEWIIDGKYKEYKE